MMPASLIVLGCGFVGTRAATFALASGRPVVGTTRDPVRAVALQAMGMNVNVSATIDGHWLRRHLEAEPRAQVLVTYPPDDTLDAQLAAIVGRAECCVVYISSTAVYGAVRGRVDEHTPAAPNEPRGQRRLAAENVWATANATIVRAPAIYGPGRGLHLRIARGEHQLPDSGDNFISRIHADDLARLCIAALGRGERGGRYVVGDQRPCPQREITAWLCARLGQPMPAPTPMSSVSPTLRNDRQVDGSFALRELGIRLQYATYQDGYEQCLRADGLISP